MSRNVFHTSWFVLMMVLASCQQSPKTPQPETVSEPESQSFSWTPIERPVKAHLRGLHVLNDSVIWASGTEGIVLRTLDGGQHWDVIHVPDAGELDFRDIEAFDDQHAIVMSSGEGVFIYRTADGGTTWQMVYEDARPEIFFDGFDFHDAAALAYGDPIEARMQLLQTRDKGQTWSTVDDTEMPGMEEDEAGFAASGTGVCVSENFTWIATGGGPVSRVIRVHRKSGEAHVSDTPLHSGEGSGIFSMCFWDEQHGAIVGGSYIDSTRLDSNGAFTTDGGLTWKLCERTPFGYRSCVAANEDGSLLIATGRSGTDYSTDGGNTWVNNSSEGYFACGFGQQTVWGVGRNGKMGVMPLQ